MIMDRVVALLPMKGNSERVPNKNLRDFNGAPLFHAIMHTLRNTPSVSHIIINTDSEQIAANAEQHFPGVIIHWRPEELCGDMVSMNRIIEYDMQKMGAGHYLQTHSTNPLLKSETLEKGIQTYFENLDTCDSVFSVTRIQTRLYWESGEPVNHNPAELIRTQDLPPVFEENSNFFIFSSDSFHRNEGKRIGRTPRMVEMDKLEAIDIDYPQDFILAETLMKLPKK